MIDKLIEKYGTLLNTLRENKSTKSETDTYDYNTDIKNTREYLKDLKLLKQQLTIPVVSDCSFQYHCLCVNMGQGTCDQCGAKLHPGQLNCR